MATRIVTGEYTGRASDDEITLFESLGLAVEDVASAAKVPAEARRRDVGLEVELS